MLLVKKYKYQYPYLKGNTNELKLNNTQEQSNSKYYPNRSTIKADNTKVENNNNLHNINKATPKWYKAIKLSHQKIIN